VTYAPRLPPRAHQAEALERIWSRPSSPSSEDVFALLMEMGTGKSKVIVDEWGLRHEELPNLLIVAPAGSYRNWTDDTSEEEISELRKHLDPELYRRVAVHRWSSGGGARRRRLLDWFMRRRGPRALVVNVEALSSVERARELVLEFLRQAPTYMVVDESTDVRGHRAERANFIVDVAGPLARARRILTGLVTPRSPMDLFMQFAFLDWRILGVRSYFAFRARYAVVQRKMMFVARRGRDGVVRREQRSVPVVVGYRNLEDLQRRVARYSYRRLKEECLDLPPKQYLPIRDVRLSAEQRRVYDDLLEAAFAELDGAGHVTATMVLTQRMRLSQVLCGYVRDDDGAVRELPEHRTDELLAVLRQCECKVIVWTSHDYVIRKLAVVLREEFGPHSVAQFWGGNRSSRGEDEARFKSDSRCRFMLATPGAGGRGNNWTVAGLAVYYDNDDNLEHRLQSEDRGHRDGLDHPYGVVDLRATGTIDDKRIAALRKKLNIAAMIQGDDYREWIV
jgi:hypothetical protein